MALTYLGLPDLALGIHASNTLGSVLMEISRDLRWTREREHQVMDLSRWIPFSCLGQIYFLSAPFCQRPIKHRENRFLPWEFSGSLRLRIPRSHSDVLVTQTKVK